MSVSAISGGSSALQKLASTTAKVPKPETKKVDADGDHDGSTTAAPEKSGNKVDVKG